MWPRLVLGFHLGVVQVTETSQSGPHQGVSLEKQLLVMKRPSISAAPGRWWPPGDRDAVSPAGVMGR